METQDEEKEKRAAELIIANKELAFQNEEHIGHLAAIVESSDDAIISKSLDGTIKSWNKGAEKMFGYTAKQAIGKHISLIIPPEYINEEKKILERIRNNEIIEQCETVRNKKSGEQFYVSLTLSPLKDQAGSIIGVSTIARDITSRKKSELEIIQKTEDLVRANKELAFQNEEKEKRAAELVIANKELAFQNEEKEKRAEELVIANKELKKAEEQFRLVVESAPNAMVLVNNEGFITLINNQTEKLFGYGRNELVGNKLEILIPERFSNEHPGHRNKFFKKSQTRSMGAGRDLFALRKNGTEIPVEIGLNPIETAKGPMVLASIIDITERKIQEATQKKYNKELVFLNDEKEKRAAELLILANKELLAFTYLSSHDLQEPLRKIQTFATIILEKENKNLSDNGKYNFQRMQEAAGRMQQLIEDLLTLSRLKTSERKFVKTDLNTIIEEVKTELKDTIQKKHATIEATDLCLANILAFQFRQLMYNLISNALKFSRPDIPSHIIIKSRIVKGSKLNNAFLPDRQEKLSPKKNYCHITVKDNGIGFEPHFSERIFEVFQKLHSKEVYAGTGIGLAIVKKIVENHNGIIIATGELKKGATFDIYIPA